MRGMATYVIGDVQGCADSLEALVSQLPLRLDRDELWFVGDLVNRGPKSLKVLKMIQAAGERATCVLGNHDLHLLALACGARAAGPGDTLLQVIKAPDAKRHINWLRNRPLAHARGNTLMVHAGVLPGWSLRKTVSLAREVEARLQSNHWQDFMHEMYGNAPLHWRDNLEGHARLRTIVNVLTRVRYLTPEGHLELKCKAPPAQAPARLTPWFDHAERATSHQRVIVGHWSTLGLRISPQFIALDSGCVWRGYLSAVRLEDLAVFQQIAID
ncbi:MAG: symmetrical bis(5'-nucleosyl)-tetraphosphatase [Betaproteobacteria bacterium]|nr:symmetrical bis(5'-nucleosyl)-tetraphosphatase [Betaproteobacteria bacterium]NBY13727.1 symmetrical bis(5'-nucleosyl)-tetraphosphatase [Betaproteobacteria bacterium]NCA15623.1 symmetrical bis(5'-nucleosyl)-tetraphosphatase [Betaproteobacteria bacterium]